jgi:hypothetical protein
MHTDNKTHSVESASVALAEGMHLVGDIDGVRIETRYCPVTAMVGKAADISSHHEIEEEA